MAQAVEAIASLLPSGKKGPAEPAVANRHIRYGRTCYDHLAGKLGVALTEAMARQCLDWSERRHHLAGSLGAALLEKMLAGDWIRRTKNSRAVILTAKGEKKLQDLLGLSI